MRSKRLFTVLMLLLMASVPSFAGSTGKSCDLSGTWYGGSDPQFQYLWVISSVGDGRFSSNIQLAADVHPFGYVAWSSWSADLQQISRKTYKVYGMSYWIWDATAAAGGPFPGITIDPSLPEVDIVRSRVELVDCNTLTNTIDVYAAYFNFTPDKIPFVTAPDVDFLAGATIVETYHRMPMACPKCPYVSTMSNAMAASSLIVGKGPHQRK